MRKREGRTLPFAIRPPRPTHYKRLLLRLDQLLPGPRHLLLFAELTGAELLKSGEGLFGPVLFAQPHIHSSHLVIRFRQIRSGFNGPFKRAARFGIPALTRQSAAQLVVPRSEERRVGKECRSWWWRWH